MDRTVCASVPMSFKLRLNLLHASTKSLTLISHSPPASMLGLNPDHNHDSFSTNHESKSETAVKKKSLPQILIGNVAFIPELSGIIQLGDP